MMQGLTRKLFTVMCLAWVAAGCGGPSSEPEAALRAWVAQGSAYVDARGNERDEIDNLLRVYFLRQNRITLLPKIEEITIYDATAGKIVMTVGMAGTNDGVLGFSADAYRFALELEKDGDDWLLISARWGELGDELH